ncbi:unnamed protein product [Echinostoma caproni]|uniref:NADH dehydrogenase [ubiquinone] 1 beta subcomplex subunit 9 n=1 Tax=Echinostoma caproni TaxID=27848 RepID=A0A183A0E2_9TREM|nr:unnamed protein product [Echinostoma caproni]
MCSFLVLFIKTNQKQLNEFEKSKEHLKLRERLFARFGPWPDDKRATDAAELKEHLAAQEYFLEHKVYPGEESLENADQKTPGKLNTGFYTVHTNHGPRDLGDFVLSRSSPPEAPDASGEPKTT